jgi:predicted small lipoprotein YifL
MKNNSLKNKIIFKIILLLLISFELSSCGKKTDIEIPPDYKRPKFDNVVD